MAKKDYLKEMQDGLEKWFQLACKVALAWWVLDLLPLLPDDLAKKVINKILGMFGLGD